MSDPQERTTEPIPRRTRRLAIIFCIVATFLAALAFILKPQKLRPGQVIDQIGTYRFPTGHRTLKITRDDFGNVQVTVRHRTTRFYVIPYSYSVRMTTFESERDWFISVDKHQRLWVFQGHWDLAWGKLRQMPSGGTIPYAPAVLVDGLWFISPGQLIRGINVVTDTGHWAGVPQEFFDRIPDRDSAQWGNVPAIPQSAPTFTRQQQIQIASRLRQDS